jgi:hypothetical protein
METSDIKHNGKSKGHSQIEGLIPPIGIRADLNPQNPPRIRRRCDPVLPVDCQYLPNAGL